MPTCRPLSFAFAISASTSRSGVDALSRRVVRGVGRASAGRLARVHLDQLGAEVDFHERAVGAHANVLPEVQRRNGVQRPRDLDVMVGMNLRLLDVDRHVEDRLGRRKHRRPLDRLEHLARDLARRPVHARAGDIATPVRGALAGVLEIVNVSPSNQLSRTNGTWFSTRGLSFGDRTRAGSTNMPRAWT